MAIYLFALSKARLHVKACPLYLGGLHCDLHSRGYRAGPMFGFESQANALAPTRARLECVVGCAIVTDVYCQTGVLHHDNDAELPRFSLCSCGYAEIWREHGHESQAQSMQARITSAFIVQLFSGVG